MAKGDSGAADRLPPAGAATCSYSARYAAVSLRYDLPVTEEDKLVMLATCRAGEGTAE